MAFINLIIFIIILLVLYVLYVLYKVVFFLFKRQYLKNKSDDLRFLLVKMPRKQSESDKNSDLIQSFKQNIEIMNQILKNFNSIKGGKFFDELLGDNYMSLELLVEKEVIKYVLGVPKDFVDSIEKIVSSFYAGAVIEFINQPKIINEGKFAIGGYFTLREESAKPISIYESFEADPMDSLLSSFAKVEWEENLSFQILISPIRKSPQKQIKKSVKNIKEGKKNGFSILSIIEKIFNFSTPDDKKEDKQDKSGLNSEQNQALEKKPDDELFEVKIKTFISSPNPKRIDKILNDFVRSFSQYSFVGLNSFVFKKTSNLDLFIQDFVSRSFIESKISFGNVFLNKNLIILNKKELSSIYHFPHSRFNRNPRIKWQNFKIVPAPDNLMPDGILLGHNLYAGVKKEIRISPQDRFRHFYIIGQTGTGKSTMILVMAKQDIFLGNGFCMIDPHGDLCEFILQNYPKERIDDLIYFDAGDFEMPIGFNPLEAKTEEERDIVTNDLIEMFVQMYGPEIFGPRIQDYFRNVVLALMEQPEGGTLIEIMRMFTDEAYQKIKLVNVKNPVIRSWWEKTYKAMGDREKQEIIPYFQAKFSNLIVTPIIRNIIGQQKSSFDIGEAIQTNKVILLNLSKGKMGELNSKLLGSMMVTQLKLAALRRAQMPENKRNPYYMYIDEFQNFINPSIETILSEARKYKLGLILAHQYIDQLSSKSLGGETDLKPAIFGNVGSQMAYKVGAIDAEFLEKEFSPEFSQSDLVNMDRFKGVIKISVNTQPTRPFSISVLNPYENVLNTPEKIKIIKEISRLKWGRKKELIEKEIYYRVGA